MLLLECFPNQLKIDTLFCNVHINKTKEMILCLFVMGFYMNLRSVFREVPDKTTPSHQEHQHVRGMRGTRGKAQDG